MIVKTAVLKWTHSPKALSRGRLLAAMAGVAAAYFVSGKLGLMLAIPPGYASPVWPAAGMAFAAVLLLGFPVVPGIFAGSFALNLSQSLCIPNHPPLPSAVSLSASLALAACLQAMLGASLACRFGGYPNPLHDDKRVMQFLILGGPVSCLLGSTVGVFSLWQAGVIPWSEIPFNCWNWWVGDVMGVMVLAPPIIIWNVGGDQRWRRGVSVTVPLALMFLLSVLMFNYVNKLEQERVDLHFKTHAAELATELRNDFRVYLDILKSVSSFFAASTLVTRQEFQTFVTPAMTDHPGLQALEWIPLVTAAQREAAEQAARDDGHPDFHITERLQHHQMVQAQPRDEYFPVYYVEPYRGNEIALGYDLGSNPTRLEALNDSRASGEQRATARITLVQEEGRQYGFLVFHPVYWKGVASHDEAERRRQLQGFVLGVFRIGKVLEAAMQSVPRTGHRAVPL